MSITEIRQLPLNEKLQIMEALWEDLTRNADSVESPEWHREVLQQRQKQIDSGQAKFIDWEQAKADIRKRVS
jgi:putative addiction module component (TIGR02574 family)